MATASATSFNLFLYQNLWSLQHPVAVSPADQACKRVLPLYLLPDRFTGNALIPAILQKSDSRLSVHLHHFMFIHSIPVDSLPNENVLVSVVTLLLCKVFSWISHKQSFFHSILTTDCHTWVTTAAADKAIVLNFPFARSSHIGILFCLSSLSFSQYLFALSVWSLVKTPGCVPLPKQMRERTW